MRVAQRVGAELLSAIGANRVFDDPPVAHGAIDASACVFGCCASGPGDRSLVRIAGYSG